MDFGFPDIFISREVLKLRLLNSFSLFVCMSLWVVLFSEVSMEEELLKILYMSIVSICTFPRCFLILSLFLFQNFPNGNEFSGSSFSSWNCPYYSAFNTANRKEFMIVFYSTGSIIIFDAFSGLRLLNSNTHLTLDNVCFTLVFDNQSVCVGYTHLCPLIKYICAVIIP